MKNALFLTLALVLACCTPPRRVPPVPPSLPWPYIVKKKPVVERALPTPPIPPQAEPPAESIEKKKSDKIISLWHDWNAASSLLHQYMGLDPCVPSGPLVCLDNSVAEKVKRAHDAEQASWGELMRDDKEPEPRSLTKKRVYDFVSLTGSLKRDAQ